MHSPPHPNPFYYSFPVLKDKPFLMMDYEAIDSKQLDFIESHRHRFEV
jgi:hypothetical protein